MKQTKIKWAIVTIFVLFAIMSVLPSLLRANPAPLEVVIRVNEHGFSYADGKAINKHFEIPKDRNIKLILEHVGSAEEEHEFILLFDSDEEISSGVLSDGHRRASIAFRTGEEGELYDVFCVIVDCDGMEHLMDLVLVAV